MKQNQPRSLRISPTQDLHMFLPESHANFPRAERMGSSIRHDIEVISYLTPLINVVLKT